MTGNEAVCRELGGLGFTPSVERVPDYGEVIAFDYPVPTGRYRGQTFRIAVGFQGNSYPEYPPHFLHVRSLLQADLRLPVHRTYERDGNSWTVFSVPPGDFWDRLPPAEKTMKTYRNRHLPRFWQEL